MKITIPKGSYHQYCRNKHTSKSSQQSHRVKLTKIAQTQRTTLRGFDNFETYLLYLQQKDQNPPTRKSHTERPYCTAQTSRPKTHTVNRVRESNCNAKQSTEIVKPFFPFFKCKIESINSPSRDSNFRISNKRLKLNYRIIEENMGKGDAKIDW